MNIEKVRELLAPDRLEPSTDAFRLRRIGAAILEVAEGIDQLKRMLDERASSSRP